MSNTENNYTETDLGNISLNPRGEYDSSAAYEYLDAVSYQGGSYFCLAELETTITGIAPDPGYNSEHWQMIALPGDMTPEYIAMHDDVINKAKQVETSRAVVELSQQEIESAHTDIQQLHSNTVQAAQEAENSRDSAAGYAQSAEQSRKAASESEQNINAQITGFDDKVTESVNQAKEEIGSTRQQAINAITSQQDTSVNTIKTEGEKIITKVEKDAKTVADDRAAVEAAAQTVADNAQEVAQNTQNVTSNTASATASAESAKTSADNAAQSAKSVEVASKQIETNKEDIAGLKEDIDSFEERDIEPLNKSVFGTRKLLLATPIDEDWSGYMNEKGEIFAKDRSDRWHKTYKLCSEDTTIKVKDWAGGDLKHCIFLDRINNVISTTTGVFSNQMLDVSVPSGARYVVVNATDSADMVVCYTHIFDTDYNLAEKMNNVNMRINSAEATTANVKESLNSVTDTIFSEKKYASLKSVEETKIVRKTGEFDTVGRANEYIVYTYIGQTLKVKGYCGGIVPLIVFFDHDDKFVSYIDPNIAWNDNVYQDVVVPEGAYKAYVNDNDGNRTIDLQGLQFEKYNIKQELERLKGLIPDGLKISYDLEQAQLQMAKTQRMNDFVYSAFDKAYFVLTIDDANKYLPDVYDLCHELGVPFCPAIIVGNLNTDYKNDGRTIKDICDLVVADGGEILAHSGKYITEDSTEEDYTDVFREPKFELENLGYTVRGIITAGGDNYLSNDIRLDNWSRKYYDYSDQNGLQSSKAYYHPRWWYHDYTMDGAKNYVDNAIKNKSFIVVAMHGSDSTSDLEHINNLRELLEYMIAKGTDNLEITTWAKVYDKFGSTKLEERIKSLESS